MVKAEKLRKRKPHFQVCKERRRLNKIEIRKKLLQFNEFLGSIGLKLSSNDPIKIHLKENANFPEISHPSNFKIKISKELAKKESNVNSPDFILQTLNTVDSTYISERSYHKIRNFK